MASKNNCISWPEGKKEQLGCGVTCDCPRVKNKLQNYDWVVTQSYLWDNKLIDLKDIDAKTFNLINFFSVEKSNLQAEREAHAREVQRMLGG